MTPKQDILLPVFILLLITTLRIGEAFLNSTKNLNVLIQSEINNAIYEENSKCDGIENGTILESSVSGKYTTYYNLLICDENLPKWVSTSPNTYSKYENGKITKLEKWED